MSDNITGIIKQAIGSLHDASDSPQLDCQILAAYVLHKDRAWLLAHGDEVFPAENLRCFQTLVNRRLAGEPVAYLTGEKEFWGRAFKVTAATLIPRPETELLIEIILDRLDDSAKTVWDLGTGSGIIAITLASERPAWTVTGTDISSEAITIAEENSGNIPNVSFLQSDWLENMGDDLADLIVSNPPYICENDEHLAALTFEPQLALSAGPDGLQAIRRIISDGYRRLNKGGYLALEHGYHQQAEIEELMTERGFANIECLLDYSGQPRAVLARKPAL